MAKPTMDLVQTWGDLDWKNIAHLCRQINIRVRQGYDINLVENRKRRSFGFISVKNRYTLFDIVIEQALRSKGKNDYAHWREIINVLKTFGAKPACAIKRRTTSLQRALARIGAEERREKRSALRKSRLLFQRKRARQEEITSS